MSDEGSCWIVASGKSRRLPRLIQAASALRGEYAGLELMLTLGPHHAPGIARRAVEAGADRVIAAGGDGTLFEVLHAIDLGSVVVGGGAVVLRDGRSEAEALDRCAHRQAAG